MQKKPIVLFDIDYTLFDVNTFKKSNLTEFKLYPEVRSALESLQKIAILGILSEGELELQTKKMQECSIENFFDSENVHIVKNKPEKLEEILNQYLGEKIFHFEDKLTILRQAKRLFSRIFTIWVRRGKYADEQKEIHDFRTDAEVFNLIQAVGIIKKELRIKNYVRDIWSGRAKRRSSLANKVRQAWRY